MRVAALLEAGVLPGVSILVATLASSAVGCCEVLGCLAEEAVQPEAKVNYLTRPLSLRALLVLRVFMVGLAVWFGGQLALVDPGALLVFFGAVYVGLQASDDADEAEAEKMTRRMEQSEEAQGEQWFRRGR